MSTLCSSQSMSARRPSAPYPNLSFIPDTQPIYNNFPHPPSPPQKTRTSFFLLPSNTAGNKLSKRNPKESQPTLVLDTFTLKRFPSTSRSNAPPSAFRSFYKPSSSSWPPRKSSLYADPSRESQDYHEMPQRSTVSDIGHGSRSDYASQAYDSQRLTHKSSGLFRRGAKDSQGLSPKDRCSPDQEKKVKHPHHTWSVRGLHRSPSRVTDTIDEDDCCGSTPSTFRFSSQPSVGSPVVRPSLGRRLTGSFISLDTAFTFNGISLPRTIPEYSPDNSGSDFSHGTDSSQSCHTEAFSTPFNKTPPDASLVHESLKGPDSPELSAPQISSIALAIADEAVSDEALVETLERIRSTHGTPGVVGAACIWDGSGTVHTPPPEDAAESTETNSNPLPHSALASNVELASMNSPASWPIAKRALLAVRELVRTERHYVSAMKLLLEESEASIQPRYRASSIPKADTTLPTLRLGLGVRRQTAPSRPGVYTSGRPSPLMAAYARSLVEVGVEMLEGFEREMSVNGVSTTFVNVLASRFSSSPSDEPGSSAAGDSAFVAWSGVVGTWFEGDDESPGKKFSKLIKRRGSNGLARKRGDQSDNSSTATSPISPGRETARIRDMAILPTQRVVRYVLLFRDLILHTPEGSRAREAVQKAVDAAINLAEKCDRAQTNSAFLMR